jgi:imidazoleglycerol phosphate synthase glutamine amidotransferase subunit HisH
VRFASVENLKAQGPHRLCVSSNRKEVGCCVGHQVLIDSMLERKVRKGDACKQIITDTSTAEPWYHSGVKKF